MNTSAKTGLLIESGFVFEIHWGVSPLYMMLVKHQHIAHWDKQVLGLPAPQLKNKARPMILKQVNQAE